MAEPFLGQIMIVGFNFAPVGWATCDGQLLPISQNTALFSILGTTYGGNGTTNFALPNLRDATPLHLGQGPGLSNYFLGQSGGTPTVTLTTSQLPQHTHTLTGDGSVSAFGTPAESVVFGATRGAKPGAVSVYGPSDANNPALLHASSISSSGSGQPHNNRQPYLGVMFVIALQGIYPSRN